MQPALDPLVPGSLGMDAIGYIQEHRHDAAYLPRCIHLRPVAAMHNAVTEQRVRDCRLEVDSSASQCGLDMTVHRFVGAGTDYLRD